MKEALKLAIQLKDTASGYWTEHEIPIIEKLIEILAQPEPKQEPVAWMDVDGKTFPFVWNVSSLSVQQGSKYLDETLTPLYTHPPHRTWEGLQMRSVVNL